ncbi:hypothetical protein [Actinocatenispora comari]|jgi:hypothetical protein|uniref:DUF2064 domain-containing protein n=1 Tax=Actinocatenispora comari TaxID=2807577 RepID=A0A8J4AEY6_9ACTN|nr:hypothetical protein [Actinocatenispora comari]GIL28385.1 hypothetical protein NUM_36390 [Actinocatenispora comari]
MTERCVLVLLDPPGWAPPGVPAQAWRRALAEDVVDLLAPLAEVDVALAATAADRPLAEAIRWPTTPVYEIAAARPVAALAAAAQAGYRQAAVLPADLPDLPGLLIGKLFRALSDRAVAAAPRLPDRADLAALASRLPVPEWLVTADPALTGTDQAGLRAAGRTVPGAPPHGDVAACPGWHRLRGPADLARLDESLEGWEATRALLATGAVR